ncbi:MAG: hypothetical protein M3Q80_02975, partial [bacterium]|nr:hypothetical protein [bacterium]
LTIRSFTENEVDRFESKAYTEADLVIVILDHFSVLDLLAIQPALLSKPCLCFFNKKSTKDFIKDTSESYGRQTIPYTMPFSMASKEIASIIMQWNESPHEFDLVATN